MWLSQFYAPLNIPNFLVILLIFLQLEIIGFVIIKLFSLPKFLRFGAWIMGMGIFVFLWFWLHFFLPFNPALVWLSLLFLTSLSFPFYCQQKAWVSLFESIKFNFWPFLFLILIWKPLRVWLSMPPYLWDEMAYHYYSPAQLASETNWGFSTYGLYGMIPRFFDTAYVLLFSMMKTQMAARFFHFGVFLSMIQITGSFLKKNLSLLALLVFTLVSMFFDLEIMRSATFGYVDTGTASLVILASLSLSLLITQKKIVHLYSFAIWISLALASKYSVLMIAFSFSLILIIFFIRDNFGQINNFFSKKIIIIKLFLLLIIFGGFWYLKNLAYTWNPIYPFLFPCKPGIKCQTQQAFFTDWTTSFSLSNIKEISLAVFRGNSELLVVTITSILAAFLIAYLTKNKVVRSLLGVILTAVFLEILLASKTSGFLDRYFFHWILFVPLLLALPWQSFKKIKKLAFEKQLALGFLMLIIAFFQLKTNKKIIFWQLNHFNNPEVIGVLPLAFAQGKVDIHTWIQINFPQTYGIINWCGEKKPEPIVLFTTDPMMIWRSPEGLQRVFMVNCQWQTMSALESPKFEQEVKLLEDGKAYLVSLVPCQPKEKNPFEENSPEAVRYQTNQEIICRAQEIAPHLYEFIPTQAN